MADVVTKNLVRATIVVDDQAPRGAEVRAGDEGPRGAGDAHSYLGSEHPAQQPVEKLIRHAARTRVRLCKRGSLDDSTDSPAFPHSHRHTRSRTAHSEQVFNRLVTVGNTFE